MKKKICYVTTIHRTMNAFVIPVAKYLAEHTDWDFSILCSPDTDFSATLPDNFHFFPVPMKRGVSPAGIGAMLSMLRIFRQEKFDLIQYSTPNAAFYASIAASIAGARHRKYHLMGFRYLGFNGLKRKVFKLIEKTTCALSTDIECVSQSNLELGVHDGIFPRNKAHVVFHGSSAGIDLERFDIHKKDIWREDLRAQFSYPKDDCVFGFAGRITKDKGINELLTAFLNIQADNAKLFIIGRMESLEGVPSELIQQAEADARITFHPYVTDIERYYGMMDVLVLPSYREGFGNIVIEAQAMGIPVIVSDIPGPTDAMEDGVTGLTVPPMDASALQQAMESLASDAALRARLGQNGRRLVEEKFDQKMLFAQILQDRLELLCSEDNP